MGVSSSAFHSRAGRRNAPRLVLPIEAVTNQWLPEPEKMPPGNEVIPDHGRSATFGWPASTEGFA